MTPERWQQVARVYQSALELDPSRRDAYLAEACRDDPELRREVEALLEHGAHESFLASPGLLPAGSRMGAYELLSVIGAGGMGVVYRATDTNLGRQVAIKVLPDAFAQDAERLARFEREAKTLAALNHPHIAQIYGLEKSGGVQALVMELVEGEDLSERIARRPSPLDEALPIARQICEALEAAHEQGIIHRDLKPANIKLRPDGTVKVLDFGLAKLIESGSGIRDSGSAGGGMGEIETFTESQAREIRSRLREAP
jgi:serine/threonine protein kinase